MSMMQHARLHAVPFFAINRVRLAPDVIIDARRRHEIAFVSGVDEHFAGVSLPTEHRNGLDPRAGLLHASGAVEPLVALHGNPEVLHIVLEHLLRRVRLEYPHRALRAVDGGCALPLVAILLLRLPPPRFRTLVMFPDAMIKIARQPSDDRLVSRVGEAKPAARQAAQMFVWANDHDRLAHLLRLHRGNDARGSAAIDHHVVFRGAETVRDEAQCAERRQQESRTHPYRLSEAVSGCRAFTCYDGYFNGTTTGTRTGPEHHAGMALTRLTVRHYSIVTFALTGKPGGTTKLRFIQIGWQHCI